jgi:hypothetical protein
MLELPDEFLNFYYSQEKFYFANKNQQPVGIIDFNPNRGLISNIGVDPQHRGRLWKVNNVVYIIADRM